LSLLHFGLFVDAHDRLWGVENERDSLQHGDLGDIHNDNPAGAISAYLLLGLLFTYLYAFLGAVGQPPLSGLDDDARLNEYLYFAFTTLTTTGYGDLSPVTNVARATAILEALLGQLYLVTVLALVVGRIRPIRRG
jgi:hypothetical protein